MKLGDRNMKCRKCGIDDMTLTYLEVMNKKLKDELELSSKRIVELEKERQVLKYKLSIKNITVR